MKYRVSAVTLSHDSKQNRSQNKLFWSKIVKILCKNREKWENICKIYICWYIGITFCTVVVYILNKDITNDTKLNKSKISNFGVKYSHFVLKCSIFIKMTPSFLKYSLKSYWMTLHFYRTCLETQKRPSYWYERWFFIWCLLRQRNWGLNSGLKSAFIVTNALLWRRRSKVRQRNHIVRHLSVCPSWFALHAVVNSYYCLLYPSGQTI